MPTTRVTIRGGALHGEVHTIEHPRRLPELYVSLGGRLHIRADGVGGPGVETYLPAEVAAGHCCWCAVPTDPGPASCSCPEDCGSWRCGRIGPAAQAWGDSD